MTQTDRILSNISAIKTLLENFPMSILEANGKTYTSAFEFIMDVLRACGIDDRIVIDFLLEKIYGFEGQPGYTINGLYEALKTDKFTMNPQNKFISALEDSIKTILMALFTSIFTCSALPILPNKVFDKDELAFFMPPEIQNITEIGDGTNDINFKLKIPVSAIDIMGMLGISPVSSQGSLYYITEGQDKFYRKVKTQRTETVWQERPVSAGEEYTTTAYTFDDEAVINFHYDSTRTEHGKTFDVWDMLVSRPVDFDIEIHLKLYKADDDILYDYKMMIMSGQTSSGPTSLLQVSSEGSYIEDITINGFHGGGEFVNEDGTKIWVYLSNNDINGFSRWVNNGGFIDEDIPFYDSRIDEISNVKVVATEDCTVDELVDVTYDVFTYRACDRSEAGDEYVRYSYFPNESDVNEDSPNYIVYYDGQNPNLLYRTYDMNAFIWYVLNRGKKSNQEELNHLMWDSRLSASKKGFTLSSEDWNSWYRSKSDEGGEFEFLGQEDSDFLYPIIQIEPYNYGNKLLLRIPAQRYFLPKKREEIYNQTFDLSENKTYFNASVYRFDWEYLQNIQILNPRLLLVRFIEHLMGFTMSLASSYSMNLVRNEIKGKLETAIKSIISADDMEVEDCYKIFSNEDFDDMLNEMLLQKYSATEYNGEGVKARVYNPNDYFGMLDSINSNATTVGNITQIKRSVNKIMAEPGTEPTTEWNFEGKFDSNVLKNIIWAIVMPIVESLFTPQVMLLVLINFELLGVTNLDEALTNDFGKVFNLLINKILGLVKSIIRFIKDKIIELLIDLFKEKVLPLLRDYMLLLFLEHITDWLVILLNAVQCLPLLLPGFGARKVIGHIDEVDYADIVAPENIPESQNEC